MLNFRAFGLISGVMALLAIACTTDSTATPNTPSPTVAPSAVAAESPVSANPAALPTTSPTPVGVGGKFVEVEPTGLVDQDPDYQSELANARFSPRGWKTDWSYHTVPFRDFLSGGPARDGIPPLDNPTFITTDEADDWLSPMEPVISLELNGIQRAYPIQILIWHEVVNDEVGGVPVTVTFCPLCNSAIVFERTVDGLVLDFGTSGNLRNSDLVMWDRQTESWWQQLTGESIVGVMAGTQLNFLAAPIVSWQDFKTLQPDGMVLSRDTGYSKRYGQNPYVGYDRVDNPPFLFEGDLDGRLQPKERVAAVSIDGINAGFPFSLLAQEGAVNYPVNGVNLAVFFKQGTNSALADREIAASQDIGSAAVFNADLNGQTLTFNSTEEGFIDVETNSTWNILGQAVGGPLVGEQLTQIPHGDHFWFAWAAFQPDTTIYEGRE